MQGGFGSETGSGTHVNNDPYVVTSLLVLHSKQDESINFFQARLAIAGIEPDKRGRIYKYVKPPQVVTLSRCEPCVNHRRKHGSAEAKQNAKPDARCNSEETKAEFLTLIFSQ